MEGPTPQSVRADADTDADADADAEEVRGPSVIWIGATTVMALLLLAVTWHVVFRLVHNDALGAITFVYTVLITTYVMSRFVLSGLYRPPEDCEIEPTVDVIVPAFNEGRGVLRTIRSCMSQEYPQDKLSVICIDDGSSDDTVRYLDLAQSLYGDRLRVIRFDRNRGKRSAMAEGVRQTHGEICVFIDSDSEPSSDGIRRIVQGFADERTGAVAGLTTVRNAEQNVLTRIQSARYFISYRLLKSAESVVGAVACASGCFSAYRRSVIEPLIDGWEQQRFLGAPCTYGDDRALTSLVIGAGSITRYDERAIARTQVPVTMRTFLRQQLRWKKSWLREGPRLVARVGTRRLRALPSTFFSVLVSIISPLVLILNLVVHPMTTGAFPITYVAGLFVIAMAYGMFYRALVDDPGWVWAVIGSGLYLVLVPQLLWAMVRIRDERWGTRGT